MFDMQKRLINIIIIAILIVALCFLVTNGQDTSEPIAEEEELDQPTVLPVTRLNVIFIDEMNDQVIKLENSVIQILGKLHIAEDSFTYSNTFVEGDRYEMIIWLRIKK